MNLSIMKENIADNIQINNKLCQDEEQLIEELDDFKYDNELKIHTRYDNRANIITIVTYGVLDWTNEMHEQFCEQFHCKLMRFRKIEEQNTVKDSLIVFRYEYVEKSSPYKEMNFKDIRM